MKPTKFSLVFFAIFNYVNSYSLRPNYETRELEDIPRNKNKYSRSKMQEKFPGFGSEWIPLGVYKNGSYIIGRFDEINSTSRMAEFLPSPEESVTFRFFTRKNPKGEEVKPHKIPPEFNPSKPSKFITHGWRSSGDSDTCLSIKDNYLSKEDVNVFIMDWSSIAESVTYVLPMRATYNVATYYSKLLNALIDKGGDTKSFHLIGHSLGAHVSGFAARQTKTRIGRVTGLDPAKPGFDLTMLDLAEGGRLKKTDAEFVDVIHTCAGYLGIDLNLGHADFYPNGGWPPQPGCDSIIKMVESCSHGRSWKYFAESIISKEQFHAYRCKSVEDVASCEHEWIPMGDPVPVSAEGVYLLKTDDEAPYSYVKHERYQFENDNLV